MADLGHVAPPAADRRPNRYSRSRISVALGTTTGVTGQPVDDLSRPVEPARMCVAGGEITVGVRETRIVLNSDQRPRDYLGETPRHKVCAADDELGGADAGTRAETKRGLAMLDRDVREARPIMKDGADVPAASETRVEL